MSWKICRFSAPRPEPRFAQEPPGHSPFWRLFRFSASVDHQMTPALFRPLFRASPSRGLHWRTGCRARLRRPSDLKHHAACREGCGSGRASGRGRLTPFSSRITPRRTAERGRLPLAGLRLAPFGASGKTAPAFPSTGHAFRLQNSFARRVPFAFRATRTAATGHLFLTPSRRPV